MTFTRIFSLLLLVVLAACTNNIKPGELSQFRVTQLKVVVDPAVETNSDFASSVQKAGTKIASAYAGPMGPNLTAKTVTLTVNEIHYKNALKSLLVGDGNWVKGVSTLSGPRPASTAVIYADAGSYAINGLLGAAIAAGGDKARIDGRLAVGVAEKAIAAAYRQKITPNYVKNALKTGPS